MDLDLVKLNLYGEGYYSGQEYNETIFLLKEDYDKLKEDFNEKEISVGEIDGKHSEVYGEVEIEHIPKEKQLDYKYNICNDGECLYWELYKITNNTELKEMIRKANDYINNLDSLVDVKYTIKKSQVKKLNNWINNNLK